MSTWGRLMNSTLAGLRAFRVEWTARDHLGGLDASDVGARLGRCDLNWQLYSNTIYEDIYKQASAYKANRSLYRHTRGIFNPSRRLIESWSGFLVGGSLDRAAGDGRSVPSALPIETDNEGLRPAIARLWRDSDWQVRKSIVGRWGSLFGDVGIRVIDDTIRERVYLDVVHPATIIDATRDDRGFIRDYVREERRPDPKQALAGPDGSPVARRTVLYRETATRDGEDVVYRTYLDGKPYPWNGTASEWREPYGFTPLVLIQHINIGLEWGMDELDAGRTKFDEVNDLGSKLHDQIRKLVEGAWLLSGVPDPRATVKVRRDGDRGESAPYSPGGGRHAEAAPSGRSEQVLIYGPAGAVPHSLVAPVDIAATSAEIQLQIQEIENDYPELRIDRLRTSGGLSGEAIRRARQPVEARVHERRPNYDNGLVRAMQMAIAIGGWRGYAGYESFGLDSYKNGDLDMRIGDRPVFAVDPLDRIAEAEARGAAVKAFVDSGCSLELAMAQAGFAESDIEAEMDRRDVEQAKALAIQAAQVEQQARARWAAQAGRDGEDEELVGDER